MTDEEMAEESLISYRKESKWAGKVFMRDENTCYKDGFLAGLKAGRPEWHKVADRDLPKEEDLEMQVLCFTTNGYQLLSLFSDPEPIFEYYEVIAWCEIPKYKEK